MKALYELLAKVGSNPKLRAWAMEQLIKLKHINYKYNYFTKVMIEVFWDCIVIYIIVVELQRHRLSSYIKGILKGMYVYIVYLDI